jgi:hypothetical protein
VSVEESKVYLTELKIELNDAQILTFGKMIHYIKEKMNNIDKIMQANIELIHIFVIKEIILQDEINMAQSDFELVSAELKFRDDRLALKGTDTYAEDNAAIMNAKDGYSLAEMSFNLHTKNHEAHVKHYAYFHAGKPGSVSILTLGYIVLFVISWYIVDRGFKHDHTQKC